MAARRYTTEFVITGDSSSGVRASRDLQRANADLTQEMQRAERQGERMTQSFESVTMHAQRLATVSGAVATAVGTMSVSQTRNIAEQSAMAKAVGVTVQNLQRWEFAAKAAGMQSGAIGDIFKDTAEKIGDFVNTGGGEAADLFEVLNLNIRDLMDLSPDQQLLAVARAFDEVGNQGAKIAFIEGLGNDATRLLPLLEDNAAALKEQFRIADQLSVAIPQSDVESLEAANQALNEMTALATGFANTVAVNLAPTFVSLSSNAQSVVESMGGMGDIVDDVADGTAMLAVVMGARLVGAMQAAVAEKLKTVAADRALIQSQAAAATAAANAAAATARRTAAEKQTALALLSTARLEAQATKGTAAHTFALQQLSAARMQAATAAGAHTAAMAANTSAARAATAAQAGLATATNAAKGALALVGGPLGAAVLAGAGIYAFREELGLTLPQIDANTTAVDKLTAGLDDMSQAAAQLTLTSLVAQLAEVRAQAEATGESFLKVGQIEGDSGGFLGADVTAQTSAVRAIGEASNEAQQETANLEAAIALVEGRLGQLGERNREIIPTITAVGDAEKEAAKAAAKAAEEQAKALQTLQQEIDPLLADHQTYIERLGVLDKALADGTISEEDHAEAVRWSAEQYTRAATGAEDYEKELKSLVGQYDSNRQKAEQLAADERAIQVAFETNAISAAQYVRMMGEVEDAQYQLALESDPVAQEMAAHWEEATKRIDETFADAFKGAFDSFDDFADGLKDAFETLMAELAYAAVKNEIKIALGFGGSGSSAGGIGQLLSGGSGGGFGGLGSLVNGAKSLFGMGGTSAGGLYASAATQSAGTLYGSAQTGAAMGTGAAGGGLLSSAAAMAGPIAAGYALSQMAQGLMRDMGVMDALGVPDGKASRLGGQFGGIVGSVLGGGLFGGDWETKDGGLQLGVSGGDITGNQYERQKKEGGWFSSDKSRTKTSALDSEFETALSQTYQAQELALRASLDTLGQQSSALNGFSTGLAKISTKGMSAEEAERAVQNWLQGVVNTAAQSVVDPSQYAFAGETTIETLNRLATALTGVNPILEQLHGNAYAASLSGGDAAASLVALSGGLEQFTQRADYYFQNFYTEAERQEAAMDQAAKAMGAFTSRTGEIVTSADELRALVDGIDRNTAAGRQLYAEAMQLAPALVEVEAGLERVRDRFADMLSEAEGALSSAEQTARSAWGTFDSQSYNQQKQLLDLLGDSEAALALERERELATIDEALRPTQQRIWAIQDEAQAVNDYASALESASGWLETTLDNIAGWVDERRATGGTPGMNFAQSGDQFERQLELARSGDREALQSITEYADRYLSSAGEYYASGDGFQSVEADVLAALEALPDQLSPEDYIAQNIKDALEDSENLSSLPEMKDLAGEQLGALNSLIAEMERSASQAISINSNIVSVRDSINALGVAQEEIARIERERAGAEIASQASLFVDRRDEQLQQKGAAEAQIGSIQSKYAGLDMGAVSAGAQPALDEGVNGYHWREDGKATNWSGWQDHFDEFVGSIRNANVGDMDQSTFDNWVTDFEQREKGHWAATYMRTVASRVRNKEIAAEYSGDMAQLDELRNQLGNANSTLPVFDEKLDQLRADYLAATGEPAPFAKGGVFTNTLVSSPTLFDMGLMGEAGPEAIVPLHMGSDGLGIKNYAARDLPMPDMPLPQFPALGNADVVQALADLRNENQQLRADINRLLGDVKTNTGNTANAVASSAGRAEQQRNAQLEEQRAATRAARLKGSTV